MNLYCVCVCMLRLPAISLSGHSAQIHFWCAAWSPAHQETLPVHWWAACMPPATWRAHRTRERQKERKKSEKEREKDDGLLPKVDEKHAAMHSKWVMSLGSRGP